MALPGGRGAEGGSPVNGRSRGYTVLSWSAVLNSILHVLFISWNCIGVASTMLLNLLRVAAVAAIAATIGVTPAILFHDYGGTLLVIMFLFAFWLFVQRWILEPQAPHELEMKA
jgi:hypothetical protein